MLLHSFASLTNNGRPDGHMILKGMRRHANVVSFKIGSAFARSHTITVPDPNFILNKISCDNSANYLIDSDDQT